MTENITVIISVPPWKQKLSRNWWFFFLSFCWDRFRYKKYLIFALLCASGKMLAQRNLRHNVKFSPLLMYTERSDTLNDLHKFSLTFGVRIQFDTWLWRFFPLDLKIHSKLLQHFNSRKFLLADEDHLQNLKRFKVTSKAFMQALFTCKCFSRFTSSTTNFQRCCRRHNKTRILTNSWQLKF